MHVGFLQYDVQWLDIDSNLSKIENLISDFNGHLDLLVLPEMFNTGYIMSPDLEEEIYSLKTIEVLKKISSEYGMVIAGSIPFKSRESYYNRMVFVDSKGIIDTFDKIHLFSPAGENRNYTSGALRKDITVEGIGKIRPIICYDLRFPYTSFNDSDYDLLVCSANWPVSRIDQWRALLQARAIENQCYVIACNRIGTDDNGYEYNGHSMIIDFRGIILEEQIEKEGVFVADISLQEMQIYRAKLPFLKDQKR